MSNKNFGYVVTAHKGTSVHFAAKGNFLSKDETSLVLGKGTRVEVLTLTPEGLKSSLEFGVYGRIVAMELFRVQGLETSYLFLLTERYKFMILSYDSTSGHVVTIASGDVHDRGRPVDNGSVGSVDPDCRMIGLQLYQGMFKVIPIDRGDAQNGAVAGHGGGSSKGKGKEGIYKKAGEVGEAFNVRLEELQILSQVFLHGCERPTLMLLYQDTREARHVKTYEFNLKEKDKVEGPLSQQNVEPGANILLAVPKPLCGAIILGEQTISYLNKGQPARSISMNGTVMKAYGMIDDDGRRFLLGDHMGNLYVLVLLVEGGQVVDMKLELLGETSCASCIQYLDNAYAYIGSHFGDSQVVKLLDERNDKGTYMNEITRYTNLAPIVDLAVVDLDKSGQPQIITCSGANKDGSLRIIRNGVGINEQANLEMPGIKGIWSLRPNLDAPNDDALVISFVGETRVLKMSGEEMQELDDNEGFITAEPTLCAGNMLGSLAVQVTHQSVRLLDMMSNTLVQIWVPAGNEIINLASFNPSQVVVSVGGKKIIYLELSEEQLTEVSSTELEYEVACLDIHSADPDSPHKSSLLAVGLWTDISARILELPSLAQKTHKLLGGDTIPRSILMTSFEHVKYLLVALGDGQLITYALDINTAQLSEPKKVTLGTQPITLTTFTSNGSSNVFAASDRPTVIYSSNRKLRFSNVNLKDVGYMCSFNSEAFPDALAISKDEGLIVGTIDQIQKLHIDTVLLGEMARRIVYQEETRTFGILTTKIEVDPKTDEEDQVSYFRIMDDQTLEQLDSFRMEKYEMVQSITSMVFEKDANVYFVVGTAFALPNEDNAHRGRLLVFQVSTMRQLRLVSETEIKGSPYSIQPFNGKLLAAINTKLCVFNWNAAETGKLGLVMLCSHHSGFMSLYTASRGEFILVGDLMRSVALFHFNQDEEKIEEIASDYNTNWTTAVEALDDDTFIATEMGYNLYVVRKNAEAQTDEERRKLETIGEFHLGEWVNRFRHGSLMMKSSDTENFVATPELIFGTINGLLGVYATLSAENYELLSKVQSNLSKVVKGLGGLDHSEWRMFSSDIRTVPSRNILDGDLIESFLDLPRDKMEEVVGGAHGGFPIDMSVEDLNKLIEELTRIH